MRHFHVAKGVVAVLAWPVTSGRFVGIFPVYIRLCGTVCLSVCLTEIRLVRSDDNNCFISPYETFRSQNLCGTNTIQGWMDHRTCVEPIQYKPGCTTEPVWNQYNTSLDGPQNLCGTNTTQGWMDHRTCVEPIKYKPGWTTEPVWNQ
jgi:hypothetical protein